MQIAAGLLVAGVAERAQLSAICPGIGKRYKFE